MKIYKQHLKLLKTDEVTNDADIKSRVIAAINEFFALLENWDFGDSFYFTELTAYVMLELAPDMSNVYNCKSKKAHKRLVVCLKSNPKAMKFL